MIILPANLTKSGIFGGKRDSFINKDGRRFKY